MSELKPCSQYDAVKTQCKAGFPIHPICWGGANKCHACGASHGAPMCMQDDVPDHLLKTLDFGTGSKGDE